MRPAAGVFERPVEAFFLDVGVVGVEMDHHGGLADALRQREGLGGGVEQMRLIAVARLQAQRHAIVAGALGDRLQRLGDGLIFAFGRRRAGAMADGRIGDAGQRVGAQRMRDVERPHEKRPRLFRMLRRFGLGGQAERGGRRDAMAAEQFERMRHVDLIGLQQRDFDDLQAAARGFLDAQLRALAGPAGGP